MNIASIHMPCNQQHNFSNKLSFSISSSFSLNLSCFLLINTYTTNAAQAIPVKKIACTNEVTAIIIKFSFKCPSTLSKHICSFTQSVTPYPNRQHGSSESKLQQRMSNSNVFSSVIVIDFHCRSA